MTERDPSFGKGPDKFSCPNCDATFGRQNGLSRHLNETHGITKAKGAKKAKPKRAKKAKASRPVSAETVDPLAAARGFLIEQKAKIDTALDALGGL